jgi:iron(III) transport system ATP-binding protein
VTHDPDEAMRVGDSVAVMEQGRIIQVGSPTEIYKAPKTRRAAALFGAVNLFHAQVANGWVRSPFGHSPANLIADGAWAEIVYRPSAMKVADTGVPAKVLSVRPMGGQLEVEAAIEASSLPAGVEAPISVWAAAPLEASLAPGADIRLFARPEDAFVFPCLNRVCRA